MSYSLLNRSATKARKEHTCMWCGHAVIAASRYVRETSVYDGTMQSFAFHEACMKANDEYFNDVGEGEFPEDAEMPFFALYQLETANPSPQTNVTGADLVAKIAQVASGVGFQANVPALDIAGQILSILAANPEHIDRFMVEGTELFLDGTFNYENGSLTYRAVNGSILSPSVLRERKGSQQ